MNQPIRKNLPTNPIQIGQINFTNVWPVSFYLSEELAEQRASIVTRVPTWLNEAMLHGKVDIGPISSFAYGISSSDYLLLPNMSVSAYDQVGSILLFLKTSLQDALNGVIALPTTSATSVNLLKIIVQKFYGGAPDYVDQAPDLEQMLQTADAALLIGDDAIRAEWHNQKYEVIDLGACWREFTGHSMTFAVWAVREQVARQYPQQLKQVYDALERSRLRAQADLNPLIMKAKETVGGTTEYWRNYFSGLSHQFGQSEQNGLQLYFRYAKECGLIAHDVPIRIWSDKSMLQVNE